MTAQEVKNLLNTRGIRPKKSLGQNFLVGQRALQAMVETASLSLTDTVVEIGPGLGALTKELVEKAGRVIAVEKDDVFATLLPRLLDNPENLEVAHEDILELKFKSQRLKVKSVIQNSKVKNIPEGYKVVGNLPYGITSPVIRKFLEEVEQKPELLVFMVQKEVAQRICAKPPKTNLLALSAQYYGTPSIGAYVDRQSFWPVPDVDSAIISIVPHSTLPNREDTESFFQVARAGFKQPRKQLLNNLSALLPKEKAGRLLRSCGIDPTRRAGTLTIAEWQILAKNLQER